MGGLKDDSGSNGEDWKSAAEVIRGVLGCSEDSSIAAAFLPVYFLGVGDLYDDKGLFVCPLPPPFVFLAVEGGSLGVV